METFRLVFYLVYRYYSTFAKGKGRETAYLTTNLLFVGALSFNVLVLLRLFNLSSIAYFIGYGDYHRWEGMLRLSFIMLPGYFLVRMFINEADLKELEYDEATIKKGKVILISYFIVTLVLLIIVKFLKGFVG